MPIDALRCLRARACFFVFLLFGSEPQAQQNECERDRKEQAGVGGEKEETDGSTSKPHNTTKANAQQLAPGRTQLNDANDAAHQHASPRSMSEKRKRITKRRRRPPKHSHSTTRSHALTHTQRKPLTTRRRGAPKHCGRETTNHPSKPLFCVFCRETATRNPKQTPFEKEIHGWCIALCAFLCAFVFVFVIVKRLRWLCAAPHISRSCACEEGERAPLGVKTRKRRLRRASFCAREENAAVMQGRWRAPTHVFLRADASNKPLPGPAARR